MAKTILIIEDDASVSGMLRDVLESEGFEVLSETNGDWGLRTFNAKPVDLIIADILIPQIQGFELIERVRESDKGRDTPIIVISGVYSSAEHAIEKVAHLGLSAYFDKPVDIDRLIDVLHDVFSSGYPEPRTGPTTGLNERPTNFSELATAGASAEIETNERGLPTKGELEETPFSEIVGRLFAARASGALMLRKGTVKKIVYWQHGVPVFVKSNLLSECLGRVMVQERLISQEECDESLRRKKQQGGRQGQILVGMGSISKHNLEFALELQLQAKLIDIFSWLEGRYQFSEGTEYGGPQIALPTGPPAMIYEGASRTMSAGRIETELLKWGSRRVLPAIDPSFRYQALQLDPRAVNIIDRTQRRPLLRELLDGADFDRADAAVLLYALCCTSLLRLVDPELEATIPPEGPGAIPPPIPRDDEHEPVASGAPSLSTSEIDAVAALAQIDVDVQVPVHGMPAASSWDALEALKDAPIEDVMLGGDADAPRPAELVGARDAPVSDRDRGGFEESVPMIFDPEDIPSSKTSALSALEGATAEAFSLDEDSYPIPSAIPEIEALDPPRPESVFAIAAEDADEEGIAALKEAARTVRASSKPTPPPPPPRDSPDEDSAPRASLLPRERQWKAEAPPPSPPPPPAEENVSMSDQIRRQVRARLEAQVERLAREKRESALPASGPSVPAVDLPKELARLERDLETRLAHMESQNCYEVLGLPPRASDDQVRAAYNAKARKMHPDRVLGPHSSHRARKLAEQTFLILTRALNTLTNDHARAHHDRKAGLSSVARASQFVAKASFTAGIEAESAGDDSSAAAYFADAAQLDPTSGLYLASAAMARMRTHPDDATVRDEVLELLEEAQGLSPRDPTIAQMQLRLLVEINDIAGQQRAAERLLRLDEDSVEALTTLKALAPPDKKKTGFFARLTS